MAYAQKRGAITDAVLGGIMCAVMHEVGGYSVKCNLKEDMLQNCDATVAGMLRGRFGRFDSAKPQAVDVDRDEDM